MDHKDRSFLKKEISGFSLYLLFLLILLFVPTHNLHAETKIYKVTVPTINIRNHPTIKSKVIGQLTEGEYIFTKTEKIKQGWAPVKIENGNIGYVKVSIIKDVTPKTFIETIKFYINYFYEKYLILTSIILIILGIILGLTKFIVVFEDYSDVTITASLILFPVILLMLSMYFSGSFSETTSKILLWIAIVIEIIILLKVIVTTFKSNDSIFKGIIAFLTKIPLTILFLFSIFSMFSSDKKRGKNENKLFDLIITAILTGVVYALVRHKTWKYIPENKGLNNSDKKKLDIEK